MRSSLTWPVCVSDTNLCRKLWPQFWASSEPRHIIQSLLVVVLYIGIDSHCTGFTSWFWNCANTATTNAMEPGNCTLCKHVKDGPYHVPACPTSKLVATEYRTREQHRLARLDYLKWTFGIGLGKWTFELFKISRWTFFKTCLPYTSTLDTNFSTLNLNV